jgi:hypothetical protein
MPTPLLAARRPVARQAPALLLTALIGLSACSSTPGPGSRQPSPSRPVAASPVPKPTPAPTPLPTPRFTNEPDPQLSALIPARLAGATVTKPPASDFGTTPGDIGEVFGELGLRFQTLVVAYIEKPRMSLYAVRVTGRPVLTSELRPYLAAAAQYVGINGLHPEAWRGTVVSGQQAWMRGEDPATLAGTTLYCWSAGEFVFLLIGSSDAANRAMLKALPGQPAPTPTPSASTSPRATASGSAAASQPPFGSPSPTASGG